MTHSTPDARILLIAGASGVVGQHLIQCARQQGWQVRTLTRSTSSTDGSRHAWDPRAAAGGDSHAISAVARALDGAAVVVNLAGSSIADGRLDASHRRRVRESRLLATRALAAGWQHASTPPPVWLQGSAVGYYGDTGEREIFEDAERGGMFLSSVCHDWEEAATQLGAAGPRVAIARLGLVLAADAPAWEKMLIPVRLGVGGPLGTGRQWWPWVDADDVAAAFLFLADHSDATGPYNVTAPQPCRQLELTRGAARRLHRPAIAPAPAFALRLALGGVADELLLPSCRALPGRLLEAGFAFSTTDVESMLDKLLVH